MNGRQKITRERRKWLQQELKAQMGDRKKVLMIAALFQWGQFLMRLISFGVVAWGFQEIAAGRQVSIGMIAIILLLLNVIGYVLSRKAKSLQGEPSRYARNQLKQRFFEVFLKKEGYFTEESFADIVTVATQGIDSLDTFYNQYLTTTLRVRLNCLTIWLLLLFLFPLGSLLLLVSMPLIPISIVLMQKRSQKIMQRYWDSYMDVGNLFMDDLKGMNTLYSYQAMDSYESEFVRKAEEFRLSTMELLKFQLQSVGYMDGVMYIGISLAGFAAAVAMLQGHMSVMTFVLVLLVGAEFFAPIRELGYCMHLLMMNTRMADRIFTFFEAAEEDTDYSEGTEINTITTITLTDTVVGYGDAAVTSPINATFKRGMLTSIAGESGIGKSTLARTLMKQQAPVSGTIEMDGQALSHLSKAALAQQMVYVSPHSYVFNTTLLANLQMVTALSEEAIEAWLDEYHLLTYRHELEQGLHTPVGEDGQRLSPGQRQQLLLARALLTKRDVYLFDEMTSSVDAQTEAHLLAAVQAVKGNAIVIWISHKMKEVAAADSVLFMDKNGHEQASPETMLQTHQGYQHFLRTQSELEAILHEQ